MWAALKTVLGKADTSVKQIVPRSARSLFPEAPKLLTLLFRDRRSKILNLGSLLPGENDQIAEVTVMNVVNLTAMWGMFTLITTYLTHRCGLGYAGYVTGQRY
jgi:hypothetical protein